MLYSPVAARTFSVLTSAATAAAADAAADPAADPAAVDRALAALLAELQVVDAAALSRVDARVLCRYVAAVGRHHRHAMVRGMAAKALAALVPTCEVPR
ncbi:MAG: hypothetical protein ACK40L_19790, partial [Hydrogenophaga sp.]